MNKTIAIILSAGKGTRMKSNLPKVLHKACGKSLIEHVIDNCKLAQIEDIFAIVGHKHQVIREALGDKVKYILQEEQLGTGHAVMQAKSVLEKNKEKNIIILMGDAPLITGNTIENIIKTHNKNKNSVTVLTATVKEPNGYGRIVKDNSGNLLKIVEQKDATPEEQKINEVNSGVYCFKANELLKALEQLDNNNAQGEYYLTDCIEILKNSGFKVGVCLAQEDDIKAVNSKKELAMVEKIMRQRINDSLMDQGVILVDPSATYIEANVSIGKDTIIYPGVIIEGNTVIGENCIIGAHSRIVSSVIGDNVEIQNSTVIESKIGNETKVGPYAYLRPKSVLGQRVKIGDFVEVKNSTIGDNSKASHLSYIGDAEVGSNVNIGCGVVFVNYDGKNKHKSIVEDDCFIGCNVNLVSPVCIKKGAFIAAGSTITENVEEESLAIARSRQINKIGYMKK